MLQLHEISKSYGDHVAVHPLNLDFQQGKTTALLGPSGCGKSTLLRILMGLVASDSGQVLFDGLPLTGENVLQLRRRMGYVIQDGGLFPHLTLRGNATLLPRYLKWDSGRIQQRLEQLAELVHLSLDCFDRYPTQVSGGQRQRVALIRALFLDPDVLLLDEPMGSLDPQIRAGLQAELREIFSSLGKTVVLVTHDIGEAAYLADWIVLLRAGRIVQQGSLRELARSPADEFVSSFLNAHRGPMELLNAAQAP